jgi:DNA-binding beta-propeller fold protein YncE
MNKVRILLLAVVGAACLASAAPAGALPGPILCVACGPAPPAPPFVYVVDENTTGAGTGAVSLYDASAGALSRVLPSVQAGLSPDAIAVTPNGTNVYVVNQFEANLLTDGAVLRYDVNADGTLAGCAQASISECEDLRTPTGPGADAIAISPDGKSAYVANCENGTLSEYDIDRGGALAAKVPAIVAIPHVFGLETFCPQGLAVSPDGKSLYVTGSTFSLGGAVVQFDILPGGVLSLKTPFSVPAGNGPSELPALGGIAISRDGRSVYVTNAGDGTVSQYSVGAGGRLSPMSQPTVAAGHHPVGIAVSPDSQSVYVADEGDGTVSEYMATSAGLKPKSDATIAAGINPVGVAVAPDGNSVYVTDAFGFKVLQYSGGSGAIRPLVPKSPATVETGASPAAIAVGPAQLDFPCASVINDCVVSLKVANSGDRTIAVSFSLTLLRAAPLGILVQRIVGERRVPVGRVPFGLKGTGNLGIRWDLLVNGRRLRRGRYSITLRMFDRHHYLIALARPLTITIR